MDTASVYNLIAQINSGDTKQAEQQLEAQRASNSDALVLVLLQIIVDQTNSQDADSATVIIQTALFILKQVVPKSWSIGFEEFIGPPISQDVKVAVRSALLGLLGFSKSKVRSVAALLVASIASVEYPDEWSDLVDILLQLIQQGSTEQIYGALLAIKELVSDTLSEIEFMKLGQSLLSTLFNVASSPQASTTKSESRDQSTGKYSPHASSMAIDVFCTCIDFFLIAEDTKSNLVSTIATPIIDQWTPLFIKYINQSIDTSDAGYVDLKLESLKAYKTLFSALPKISSRHMVDMFQATLSDIFHLLPVYEQVCIKGEDGNIPEIDPSEASNVFIHENLTIDNLVLEELDFIDMAMETRPVIIKVESVLRDFLVMMTRYAQIPKELEEWEDDMDDFVQEESELSIGKLVRGEVANIITVCGKSRHFSLLPILWDNAYTLSQELSDNWKIKESTLYLFTRLIVEGTSDHSALPGESIEQFIQFVYECQQDSSPLLRSRAFLSAASVTRALSSRIDTREVRLPLFESTLHSALNDPNDTVRVSSVMAMTKYCKDLPEDLFLSKEESMYLAIHQLAQKAQDETPSVLAESVVAIAERNLSRAAVNPDLVRLLYELISKDPTNVMLTNEIQDVMAEITETATDDGVFTEFIENALTPLVQSIIGITDWEYTPELALALDILSVLIENAPSPMPPKILETLFDPVYQITMNSSDNQILQSVSEILAHFTTKVPDQLKSYTSNEGRTGVELLIFAVARLLDPVWSESASVNTGSLILSIVQNFGDMLGDLLPQMIEATVRRLATAANPALIENLIAVFSKLVNNNATGLVDLLASISIPEQGNGLDIVLKQWLSNFDVLRGYDEIRENVLALGQLFQLNDSRIAEVVVQGEPVPIPANVILTRSKAKQFGETYTKIPAPAKIVKLFLRELIVGQSQSEPTVNNVGEDGDEWEDEIEEPSNKSYLEGTEMDLNDLLKYTNEQDGFGDSKKWAGSDNETQLLIANWMKDVVGNNLAGFQENVVKYLNREESEFLQRLMNQ